ncbi:hypothetical protein GGI20_000931 [Coemansia sp. BCRC 34301]|nr:hypothetical protein GGI20_000931 [Coemansia sp. BCRC 34301]
MDCEFGHTLDMLRGSLAHCVQAVSADSIPWSWVAVTVSQILCEHSSGVTRAVVLAELEAAWHRHSSSSSEQEQGDEVQRTLGGFFLRGNTAPGAETLFSLRVVGLEQLAGTCIWMWRLSGSASGVTRQMTAFVHQRFYPMIEAAEFDGFFGGSDGGRAAYLAGLRVTCNGEDMQLLPTTAAVFVLRSDRDALMLRAFFGVEMRGGHAVQTVSPEVDAGQVWGVVQTVDPPGAVVEIIVQPPNAPPRHIAVEFRGAAATSSLARAFRRGDSLGLVCASAGCDVAYGAQTLAFVLPRPAADAAPVPQPSASSLALVKAGAKRVTLLVRVVAVSPNIPAPGQPLRRALRVADATATRDATVWGALAGRAARLRAGQSVLLSGFEAHDEDGPVMLNASLDVGSAIYDISALPALPPSAALRRLRPLACTPATSCYARASVTCVAPLRHSPRDSRDHAGATKLVHATCGRRVAARAGGGFACAKCARDVTDTASVFALAVTLDDGTAVAHARVAPPIAAMMLAMSPDLFLRLPTRHAQLAALARPLAQPFIVCLTPFSDTPDTNTLLLRIDAATNLLKQTTNH